jgi:Phosphotransferase enzyme family
VSTRTAPPGTVPIADSVDELLEGCERREPWKTTDSLSGSRFERVSIAGVPHVVKYVSVDDDWIMRATGDLGWRQFTLLSSGVLASLPESIDHAIVGCAPLTSDRGHRALAILMRDVSASMVPAGSEPISLELHRSFIDHMAAFHAAFWGLHDDAGLFPAAHHYVILTPMMSELEAASPHSDPVPPAVGDGWRRLDERFPAQALLLRELASDPWPLVAALQEGPQTLIHGDWKLGNLGHERGRTILLDWDRTGVGAPSIDLAWYLAVNCDRLPESKEDTIAAYRGALESAGIATASWWAPQLAAALAGAFLQLAWSKTEDAAEFGWWSDRFNAWRR